MLNGTNFKYWKKNAMIVLGCMDLDLALRTKQLLTFELDNSAEDKKAHENWERSNKLSLMITRHAILETFRGTMSEETTVREFFNDLEKRFAKNEKVETSTLLANLVSIQRLLVFHPMSNKGRLSLPATFALVYSEVNITSVPKYTWWIDSGVTTHISVSMQGCLSCRTPSDGERHIFVGDGSKVEVEAIGHFRLLLRTGCYLDLKEIFVVLSFRRNLISVSVMDISGYSCLQENGN